MIKNAFVAFLIFGTLLGASYMFDTMYDAVLTDYTFNGISQYTSNLYTLGGTIFNLVTNSINETFMPIIDFINTSINVIQDLFNWLSTSLSNLISFFGG